MAEENTTGAQPGVEGGALPPASGQEGTDVRQSTPTPEGTDVRGIDHKEFAGLRKEAREAKDAAEKAAKAAADAAAEIRAFFAKQQKPPTTTTAPTVSQAVTAAPPAANETAELRAELALKEAIADAGLGKFRKQIEKLWRAEKPEPGDATDAWLKTTAEFFGMNKPEPVAPVVAKPAPTVTPTAPTDTGPPATRGKTIPANPSALSAEAIASMSDVELRAHYESFKAANGGGGHPLGKFKRERNGGGRISDVATAIAQALNQAR